MIDLHSLANTATTWAIRYLVVSTPLLVLLLAAARLFPRLPHRLLDYLWKGTLVGSLVIAMLLGVDFQRPAIATFEISLPGSTLMADENNVPAAVGAENTDEQQSIADVERPVQQLHWPTIITALWLIGTLAGLGLLAIRNILLYRRIGNRPPVMDGRVREIIGRLRSEAGLAKPFYVSSSRKLFSPIAIGSLEVCLPEQVINHAKDDELESMIAHEIAHLVRRDPIWLALWNIVIAVLFFQPLLLPARRRFQATAEYLCDSWAISHTRRPEALVRSLVGVAEDFRAGMEHRLAVGMASSKRTLLDRARAALEERHENPRSKAVLWGVVAVITLFGAALVSPAVRIGTSNPDNEQAALESKTIQTDPSDQNDKKSAESAGTTANVNSKLRTLSSIVRFSGLLRFLIEPGNETMPNPRPGEASKSAWHGNLQDTWDELKYEAQIKGVVLTDDEQRIHSIEPGGFLRFSLEADGNSYRLEIEPGKDGKLHRRFWYNGRETVLQDSHRAEISALLDKAFMLAGSDETKPVKPSRATAKVRSAASVSVPTVSDEPDLRANTYYSTGNSRKTFVVYYNTLLRSIFDPANEHQPNQLSGGTSEGTWNGGISESQKPWNYRVQFRDVVLTDDRTRIHHIESGGYFRFTVTIDGHSHRIIITPTGLGELQRRYWRDYEEKTLGSEDQRELLDILARIVTFSEEREQEKTGSGSGTRNR